MDPVSAIGFASSIIALVDTVRQIIDRLDIYVGMKDKIPRTIRTIKNQLPLLLSDLNRLQEDHPESSSADRDMLSVELTTAVSGCLVEVQCLQTLLERVTLSPGDNLKTRLVRGWQSVMKEKSIAQSWIDIKGYHAILAPHIRPRMITSPSTLSSYTLTEQEPEYIWEVPARRISHFVSRNEIIIDIQAKLESASEHGRPRSIVLIGLGGQGKTQIALEYCRLSKAEYQAILWVDASSVEMAKHSLAGIASRLMPNESRTRDFNPEDIEAKIAYARRVLSGWKFPWLMVLDNLDDPLHYEAIADFIPDSDKRTLFTTSRHMEAERLGEPVHIGGMTVQQGSELLLHHLQTTSPENDELLASQIVQVLGHLPLAIDQARAYIHRRKLPLDAFLAQYQIRKDTMLTELPGFWEYRRRNGPGEANLFLSVATTFELSFVQLDSLGEDTNKGVQSFLKLMAFLHPHHIAEDIFQAAAQYKELRNSTPGIAMFVGTTSEKWDHTKFEDVVSHLQGLSLIHILYNDGASIHLSIHPLVSEWLRIRLANDTSNKTKSETYSDTEAALYSSLISLSIQAAQTSATRFGIDRSKSLLTPELRSWVEGRMSKGPEALVRYSKSSLQCISAFISECDIDRMTYSVRQRTLLHCNTSLRIWAFEAWSSDVVLHEMYVIAKFTMECGHFVNAEALLHIVLDGASNVLPADDGFYLRCRLAMADVYHKQDRNGEALNIYNDVLPVYLKLYGEEQQSTIELIRSRSIAQLALGDLQESEAGFRQVLEAYQRKSAPKLEQVHVMNDLAQIYRIQHRLDEAEAMFVSALDISSEALGEDHPLVTDIMHSYAINCHEKQDFVKAEQLHKQAHNILNKTYGPNDPKTLTSENALGNVHVATKQYEKAEKCFRNVFQKREIILGSAHTSTIATMSSLAIVCEELDKMEEAEALLAWCLVCLEAYKNANNLEWSGVALQLAKVLARRGCYDESICMDLCARALEGHRKLLGETHPRTLASMELQILLALKHDCSTDQAQNNKELCISLVTNSIKLHGPDAVNTNTAARTCLGFYQKYGQASEVETLIRQVLKASCELAVEEKKLAEETRMEEMKARADSLPPEDLHSRMILFSEFSACPELLGPFRSIHTGIASELVDILAEKSGGCVEAREIQKQIWKLSLIEFGETDRRTQIAFSRLQAVEGKIRMAMTMMGALLATQMGGSRAIVLNRAGAVQIEDSSRADNPLAIVRGRERPRDDNSAIEEVLILLYLPPIYL